MRAVPLLQGRYRIFAVTSDPQRVASLRAAGVVPLVANLDQPASLRRLASLAPRVLHLAPPPGAAPQDARTRALLRALARRGAPQALVYGSTTGVYGDCAGALVRETRPIHPQTLRAQARAAAEGWVRAFGRAVGARVSILRIPGIYAPNRAGGARERLLKGTPVLAAADDVYTGHIHADDLARTCVRALWCGRPQRVVNVGDDSRLKMGEYYDLAADLYGLPRPPRVTRAAAREALPPMLLSFMGESRRIDNTRLKRELRLRLRYPGPDTGLLS